MNSETELNAAIAEKLGGRLKILHLGGVILSRWWHRNRGYVLNPPNYTLDANTRAEMLASLTEEELSRLAADSRFCSSDQARR
jgi:hypothetical protein